MEGEDDSRCDCERHKSVRGKTETWKRPTVTEQGNTLPGDNVSTRRTCILQGPDEDKHFCRNAGAVLRIFLFARCWSLSECGAYYVKFNEPR